MNKLRDRYMVFLPGLILVIMILFYTITSPVIGAAKEIEINIPEEVTINQAVISLGSIARIEGVRGQKLVALKKVKLDQAPRPGYERRINRQLVNLILQDEGYSSDSFKLTMPQVVRVKTAYFRIDGSKLVEFARGYIRDRVNNANLTNLTIEPSHYPQEVVIPDTEYELQVNSRNNIDLLGKTTLPVDIMIKGKKYKRVYLGFTVNAYQEVLVAQSSLIRGDKLHQKNFKKENMKLNDIRGNPILDWDNPLLQDSVINQPLGKGQVLTEQHLQKPILIGWGDEVQAEVIIGSIRASTMVKARGSGKKGEYIRVENLRTGQNFKAEIINSNLVRIERQ